MGRIGRDGADRVVELEFDPNVGADQPAGTYLGVVFDPASGEPVGTASVTLAGDDG